MLISVLPNGMHSSPNLDDGLIPHDHRLALTPSQTVADLLNITVAQADALTRTKQILIA
jgi:hypothetical protein